MVGMYRDSLHTIGFLEANGTPVTGLVPIAEDGGSIEGLSLDERVAVADAASFEIIDYAFFRRFDDGRSSQLVAYIVDNTDNEHEDRDLAEVHREVWLQGTVPLLYIAWPTRIDVLACGRGADFWQNDTCEYRPERKLETAASIDDALRCFSARRLVDGTFWEDPANWPLTDYKKAAHHSLIQAVRDADDELGGNKRPVMRRLLLLMVLIKYLEDRDVFPGPGWFGNFHKGARSFFDILKSKNPRAVYKFLGVLESRFNGDVFDCSRFTGPEDELLTPESLQVFAELVEAKTLKAQWYLWELYSFAHLPVEIISHLYQHFVPDGQGAVYTPPFLATLLLDKVMPYERLSGKERILDPSCGSGVFLVGAYRRLVSVWRKKNRWARPTVDVLKQILKDSIFGIEKDATAVDLAAFSLSLAVCDALRPEVIWGELRFDRLRDNNLIQSDFFDNVLEFERDNRGVLAERFDIIVGNPPFMDNSTEAGRTVESNAKRVNPERGNLPDKNVAYLFLEQSVRFLSRSGSACLLQPNGILYNANTANFRTQLISKYRLREIHDFISIRSLYEADTKTVALQFTASDPETSHQIVHWTYRRTASVHQRIGFEIDHYDYHLVPQEVAERDPFVWRANLLGGGRLGSVSERFMAMTTLDEYLANQEWEYGEGFIAARSGRRVEATFLTGLPLLETTAFKDDRVDRNGIGRVTETLFRSPYTIARFSSPMVLLKKKDSLPIVFWDSGPLAYRHRILGIHAPRGAESALRKFYESFLERRPLYRFLCLLHGTEALVDKATALRKQDIDMLPYPQNSSDLTLSFWEEVLRDDVCDYMADFVRLGQESDLLSEAADTATLKAYAALYVRMLGSVYENLHSAEPIFLDGLTCQPFYFGECPDVSWVSDGTKENLERLIYDESVHGNLRTIRVLKLYDQNTILIVKPDRLRYWIRSTAIRDADETLTDLVDQGY